MKRATLKAATLFGGLLFLVSFSAAAVSDMELRLASISIPETCNSTLEYTADLKHVPSDTALDLYKVIHFAFDEYEPVDIELALQDGAFPGLEKSDLEIIRPILDLRKKHAFDLENDLKQYSVRFEKAKELLQPLLKSYGVSVTEVNPDHC